VEGEDQADSQGNGREFALAQPFSEGKDQMNYRLLLAAAVLPFAAIPNVAFAQDEEAEASGPITISGEVGVFTDYRFRGLSLTNHDWEMTAELSVEHESGLYAGLWASNVELGNGKASNVEMDWSAGWSKEMGAVTVDVGAVYYTYANHSSLNYVEFYGSVGTTLGPVDVTVGAAYAPSQNNIGSQDNTYVYISGELPVGETPLSLHGTFGFEDGAFANNKKDWIVGASYDIGSGFSASLDYVDTAHSLTSLGDATVVGSIKFAF
jgi:uncharacterized protein (TIGR02001 family)